MRNPATMIFLVIGLCITSTQVRSDQEPPSMEERPSGAKLEAGTAPAGSESPELQKIVALANASRTLRELATGPIPDDLSPEERQAVQEHNSWLERRSRDLEALAKGWRQALSAGKASDPSFWKQYLELQQQLQQESHQFDSGSKLIRARHETARAAIEKIR